MEKQQQIKKLVIILVVMGMFALSYYYYAVKAPRTLTTVAKSAVETQEPVNMNKTALAATMSSPAETAKKAAKAKPASKKEPAITKENNSTKKPTKIKPADKTRLISAALGSAGKADPFSYGKSSRYLPGFNKSGSAGLGELPPPPNFAGAEKEITPEDRVQIKGFLGDKVIAEIDGITNALASGEKLSGVKVLSVNAANFESSFLIDGKAIAKRMLPIVNSPEKAGLTYIDNPVPVKTLQQ